MNHVHDPMAMTRSRCSTPIPDSVDVAIIGAGTAGLMAGAELSARGARVALFDHHYVAGGCATQFARGPRKARYHFDVGLHYVGDCGPDGVMPGLLANLGVDVTFEPLDPDGFDTLIFPDFRFRIPADLDLYRDRLVELFPTERRGIDRYVSFVRQVTDIGQRIENSGGKLTPATLWAIITKGRTLAIHQKSTLATFLDSCTRDPHCRAVMMGQHGDYGLPPSEVAAVLHAGLAAHYFKGAYYPRGGGQVISDKLADAIESKGGTIHLRRGIDRILVENGRAVGVRTESGKDGAREVRAKAVLSAADLNATLQHLLGEEHLPPRLLKRVNKFQMAEALFMTVIAVQRDMGADGMAATNYWQFDDYDVEGFYKKIRQSPEIETHCAYITSASLKDPHTSGHVPEGMTNVEIMSVVSGSLEKWGVEPDGIHKWGYKKNERYQETKKRIEQDMLARFLRLFPTAEGRICFQESATPITHSRYTRATGGTGYGLACTPSQFLDRRPGYEGPIDGLFLCGVSTRAGHGIVGAMLGGHHASKVVAKSIGA